MIEDDRGCAGMHGDDGRGYVGVIGKERATMAMMS